MTTSCVQPCLEPEIPAEAPKELPPLESRRLPGRVVPELHFEGHRRESSLMKESAFQVEGVCVQGPGGGEGGVAQESKKS